MTDTKKKLSVSRLFWAQIALNFVVVAFLIACGALLTFKVMGEEYSELTIVGFIATVLFSFIVFLPAGTLFASRAEFAKDKVQVREDERTGAVAPIADPLLTTAPLGVAFAAIGTGIIYLLVYRLGWMPTPFVAALVSLLFVVPYAIIVRLNIFRDMEGLAAQGAFRGKAVTSKTRHVWMYYIVPNVIFQAIINLPLGYRGFSHAAAAIADRVGPDIVPAAAVAPDFAITFMFVCGFTFLGVIAHTASDMYEGEFSYSGRAHGINGFLYFILIILMGVGLGVLFALVPRIAGVETIPFALAMVLKFLVVFLSVYVACRLGVGWMGKKFNDAVTEKMATMARAG
ncbi:MAG: hypothetical protein ABSC25_25125 [Roseiarcus sp.]|jgi:hypothetical protein